jgi:hypothetical protein
MECGPDNKGKELTINVAEIEIQFQNEGMVAPTAPPATAPPTYVPVQASIIHFFKFQWLFFPLKRVIQEQGTKLQEFSL